MKVVKGIDAVMETIKKLEEERDNLPYEIDGMVIKVNDLALQDRLGITTRPSPLGHCISIQGQAGHSKLLAVHFQVGRTGAVTPVPVPAAGAGGRCYR